MSQTPEASANPGAASTSRANPLRTALLMLAAVATVALVAQFGRRFWNSFSDYRETVRLAEDSAPVGYVGTALRRSYHNRPAQFIRAEGGKKWLYAAKREDGKLDEYDVTEAAIPIDKLSGGFGRDSTPGIDYPLFEKPDSERSGRLRDRQEIVGLPLKEEARAYPVDLLRKIEIVNDRSEAGPILVVFDRSTKSARVLLRVDRRQGFHLRHDRLRPERLARPQRWLPHPLRPPHQEPLDAPRIRPRLRERTLQG